MNQSSVAGPITLYHKRRARMERVKGLSHVVPAMVLLSGVLGWAQGHEPLTLLLGVEMLIGAAYVVLLVRELRQLQRHGPAHHERVAWLELAAAGIFALEGYHIWHRHHEAALRTGEHRFHALPWVYWGVAVVYVGLAFGMARLHKRRFLHLHSEGVRGRLHPFRKSFSFTWPEVAHLAPQGPTDVVVHFLDGRQQHLSFRNVHNGATHRDQLLAHAERRPTT